LLISDKLKGKEFANFDRFREAFWSEVAKDPSLVKQFSKQNSSRMSQGRAPFSPDSEQVGGRERFELDHINPIGQGGEVYNIENLSIKTPKAHIERHKK